MISGKKMYYSIKEVCELTGLKQHVLRYWESKFTSLKPKKNRAGNRAYREKDIRIVKEIKHLLYEEKLTISGAIKKMETSGSAVSAKKSSKSKVKSSVPKNTSVELSITDGFVQGSLFPTNSNDSYVINELKEVLKILSI